MSDLFGNHIVGFLMRRLKYFTSFLNLRNLFQNWENRPNALVALRFCFVSVASVIVLFCFLAVV